MLLVILFLFSRATESHVRLDILCNFTVCVKKAPGVAGPSGRPAVISTQPKRGWEPHHHVEAAVDWCSFFFFFGPFSVLTYASPKSFPFLSVTNIAKLERLYRAASRAISGCLLFSPIPLLSEVSLPPLRVTPTHFVMSSCERALRLPTSFAISSLARLGVKPRLCRSSWRAFKSTHPLVLPSTSPYKALLACPPSPPWSLPSFTVESTLSSSCSRSDPPLTCPGTALAHLDSLPPHDLVIWADDSVPFPFGKGGLPYLPAALSVALRRLLCFRQA